MARGVVYAVFRACIIASVPGTIARVLFGAPVALGTFALTAHLTTIVLVLRDYQEFEVVFQRQVLATVADMRMLSRSEDRFNEVMHCLDLLEKAMESYGVIDRAR